MRRNWFERGRRAEDVPGLLREIIREHPNWPKVLVKREYRRRRAAQGMDWMSGEAQRAQTRLSVVDAEVRRLAQQQEAKRA